MPGYYNNGGRGSFLIGKQQQQQQRRSISSRSRYFCILGSCIGIMVCLIRYDYEQEQILSVNDQVHQTSKRWRNELDLEMEESMLSENDEREEEEVNKVKENTDIQGIHKFIKRMLPNDTQISWNISLILGKSNECFSYQVDDHNSVISIQGTSLSAITKGFGHLYSNACKHPLISWLYPYLLRDIPTKCLLSSQQKTYQQQSLTCAPKYRYYLNQVTPGYSTTWWNCSRWLQEADWMALRGVNIVLMHLGQEALFREVFQKIYKKAGLVDISDDFLTGEQYFSWHRMGNIQTMAGPPTEEYVIGQLRCAHVILDRFTELGIQPILPMFNGHVPRKIIELFGEKEPHHRSSRWSGFNSTNSAVFRLKPSSVLFKLIGTLFMKRQFKEFSKFRRNLKFFSVDLFNEMDPSDSSNQELEDIANLLVTQLPHQNAKIVMQLWCVAHDTYSWTEDRIHAFFRGFPPGRIVLLDLHGEKRPVLRRFGSLFHHLGHEIIWTMLQNFGGAGGMAGELNIVQREMDFAMRQPGCFGIGISMEAIERNEILFDFVLNRAWLSKGPRKSMKEFISTWAMSRYPKLLSVSSSYTHEKEDDAGVVVLPWICAMKTVYSRSSRISGWGPTKSVIEQRPYLGMRHHLFQPTDIDYEPKNFLLCIKQMILACEKNRVDTFDVIDFVRQGISDAALIVSERVDAHFSGTNTLEDLKQDKILMLHLIDLMDDLLSLHPKWRVEAFWSPEAKSASQKRQARMILSNWFEGNQVLVDYASHQLSGLIKSLYRIRWEFFLDTIINQSSSPSTFFNNLLLLKYDEFEMNFVNHFNESTQVLIDDTTSMNCKNSKVYQLSKSVLEVLSTIY